MKLYFQNKIPEPSFSLTFSIFQYSTMNLKTSNVKTKVKLNFMSVTPCFLGKFLPIFEVFEKFLPHLNSERKEKKRKGWDIILQILEPC
jgi:hypothetical protein